MSSQKVRGCGLPRNPFCDSVWRVRSFAAVSRLVTDNQALAHHFALKHGWRLGYNEALSIALEGLLDAARRFEPRRTVPFGTYAGLRIRWLFSRYAQRAERVRRGGRAVHVSLEAPVGEGPDELGTTIADPAAVMAPVESELTEELAALGTMLAVLGRREREVVERRFGVFGRRAETLEEVGARLRVTRERVRQIEADALEKLNHCRRSADPRGVPVVCPVEGVRSRKRRLLLARARVNGACQTGRRSC